jgi:undecaprenyl-diphosphatase
LSVGLAQCFALFPGISRSGATIVGGLLAGMDRRVATEYSFFLALPTMIVATVYQLLKSLQLFTRDDMAALSVGLVVSFLVGWAVIAGFLAFVKNHSLRSFAYYRIALGVIVLAMFY